MNEKTSEISRKESILLRDVKTVDYAPAANAKRQQSPLAIDITTTTDGDHSFIALTPEEKKEFLTNLRKVSLSKSLLPFSVFPD